MTLYLPISIVKLFHLPNHLCWTITNPWSTVGVVPGIHNLLLYKEGNLKLLFRPPVVPLMMQPHQGVFFLSISFLGQALHATINAIEYHVISYNCPLECVDFFIDALHFPVVKFLYFLHFPVVKIPIFFPIAYVWSTGFCPPPHEVRKGDYWIRHRLSVRPSVRPLTSNPQLCLSRKNTIILSRWGTLELRVHWFALCCHRPPSVFFSPLPISQNQLNSEYLHGCLSCTFWDRRRAGDNPCRCRRLTLIPVKLTLMFLFGTGWILHETCTSCSQDSPVVLFLPDNLPAAGYAFWCVCLSTCTHLFLPQFVKNSPWNKSYLSWRCQIQDFLSQETPYSPVVPLHWWSEKMMDFGQFLISQTEVEQGWKLTVRLSRTGKNRGGQVKR